MQESQYPFVLSLDAILNIDKIVYKFGRAIPQTTLDQARPELHLPIPLLAYTQKNLLSRFKCRRALQYVDSILYEYSHALFTNSTEDQYFEANYPYPFISIVFDTDHGIKQDPAIYGAHLVPAQLLITHATFISDHLVKEHQRSHPVRPNPNSPSKSNVTIVTNHFATTVIARAEGFNTWNYDEPSQELKSQLKKLGFLKNDSV